MVDLLIEEFNNNIFNLMNNRMCAIEKWIDSNGTDPDSKLSWVNPIPKSITSNQYFFKIDFGADPATIKCGNWNEDWLNLCWNHNYFYVVVCILNIQQLSIIYYTQLYTVESTSISVDDSCREIVSAVVFHSCLNCPRNRDVLLHCNCGFWWVT